MSSDDQPRGVSGRWVVVLVLVGAIVTVVVAFAVIKPPPGFEPAPAEARPFGPATAQDVQNDNTPLIRRGTPAGD